MTNKLGAIVENTTSINDSLKSFWDHATPLVVELKGKKGIKRFLGYIPAIINLITALIRCIAS